MEHEKIKYGLVSLLSIGHLITDLNQGALPALLPFLITEYHLSYDASAGIVFSNTVVSSFIQPLFGHFPDRLSKPWFMPLGILLAGLGISVIGILKSYHLILFVVAISVLGIAAFHPEGAKLANYISSEKKATVMSIFGIGGQLGFAIGPIITTAILLSWRLRSTDLLALPAIIVSIILAQQSTKF